MLIETSGIVVAGACDIQIKGCEAKKIVGPLTVVWGPNRNQINVCGSCLEMKIKSGEWELENAAVPKMRFHADLELINGDKRAIVEVKAKEIKMYNILDFISKNIKKSGNVMYLLFVAKDRMRLLDKKNIENQDLKDSLELNTKDVLSHYISMLSYTNYDNCDGATRHSMLESALALLFGDVALKAKSIGNDYFPSHFIDFVKRAKVVR